MEWQSINSEVSGFLASLVAAGYNIFISGGTGSDYIYNVYKDGKYRLEGGA